MKRISVAPMQGVTDCAFRRFLADVYPGVKENVEFFTPFLRIEKGVPRRRDVSDATSTLNAGLNLTPQIIFRDREEFETLASLLISAGYNRIDLNLGCPFVPQVKKGRGAGWLLRSADLEEIASGVSSMPEVEFSLKMRLGVDSPEDWAPLMPVLNAMPLRHVTLHPRTAREQYSGTLHEDMAESFRKECVHTVIFNGGILTPSDIDARLAKYPAVMIGRGLACRPSLISEWLEGEEWSRQKRLTYLLDFHNCLLQYFSETLCGPSQILNKLRPLWDYFGAEVERRELKKILKSTSLDSYCRAVGCLGEKM